MFLFTTKPNAPEPTQQPTAEGGVARHLRQAAESTGISFDYLMRTAKRESGLNPTAKAQSSSATGLFQFIEQTWLGLVKKEGANHGLAAEAEAIQQDRSGRYVVPDDVQRKQILNLRKDPGLASTFAGVFTQKNRDVLKGQLNREPNSAELYMAHFLGANGASELISMAETSPTQSAVRAFPDAASANRSIFFDGKGRARTVREVYARLSTFHGGEQAAATTAVAAAQPPQAVDAPTRMVVQPGGSGSIPRLVTQTQARTNNAMHGLFRTGGETQGADKLRKTWLNVAESRLRSDSPSFFPREGAVQQVAALEPEAVAAPVSDASPPAKPVGIPMELPLPPVRSGVVHDSAKTEVKRPLNLTRFSQVQ
ncbi:MAG: transglycosylase SLT domain-containing protein [Rhabdaerophilum sp.]